MEGVVNDRLARRQSSAAPRSLSKAPEERVPRPEESPQAETSSVETAAFGERLAELVERMARLRKALEARSFWRDARTRDAAVHLQQIESMAQALFADRGAALRDSRRQLDESRDQRQRDLETILETRQKLAEHKSQAQATLTLLKATEDRLMNALCSLADMRAAETERAPRRRIAPAFSWRQMRVLPAALRRNALFDSKFYLATYPDVRAKGMNALRHFLEFGASEGRKPNRMFDCKWYLEQNPDVRAAGVNPLLHYCENGGREGRDPHPLFSTEWYLRQLPQLKGSAVNPLEHYLAHNHGVAGAPIDVPTA